MKTLLRTIERSLFRVESILIVVILLFMVVFAFLQVVLRNFWGKGFLWGDIFLRHLVLWVGFLGASIATRDNRHINIDITTRSMPPNLRRIVHVATSLIAAGVSVVLTKAAITFVALERESETILFGNVPTWWLQVIIPVGFALIGFRFVLRALQLIFDPEGLPQPPQLPTEAEEDARP